jgi:hypothetical protein
VAALLGELRDDLYGGRRHQSWSPIPAAFLDNMDSQAERPAVQPAGPQ